MASVDTATPVVIRALSGRVVETLSDGWQVASITPGAKPDPAGWMPTHRPVALDDHLDHWFRRSLHIDEHTPNEVGQPSQSVHLFLEGIATVADVWWNGELIATSTSMFEPICVDISQKMNHSNQLVLHCRSVQTHLASLKIARARWKTRLVVDQRLRGVRTTLLGHIPSWTPPSVVVGAWRPIRIETSTQTDVASVRVLRTLQSLKFFVTLNAPFVPTNYVGKVTIGTTSAPFTCDGDQLVAEVTTTNLDQWFPHTHGLPNLHQVIINLCTDDNRAIEIDLGRTGIRSLSLDRGFDGEGFRLSVNDVKVFCRGGALMPLDVETLYDDPAKLRNMLELLQDAGVNMVRISGTTVPASTELFDLCDELGILVWHDLPLANFDYPSSETFVANLITETKSWLDRASLAPSLAIVCGGSEIEQQATMTGLQLDQACDIPLLDSCEQFVHSYRSDLIFVRSSPTGGHLPFAIDQGVSHYFGVGAYRRPLGDARTSGVRFATECLAFANVPSQEQVTSLLGNSRTAPTDPLWKERVPRDRGTGWDFDDVRDHYMRLLFGLDPLEVRYTNPEWYLTVSRAISAEVMKRTFTEWRRGASTCDGALVWFLNDLWAGAGWGVIDSTGEPKAALHGMAQALQPVTLLASDEGLNGLDFWVCNDQSSDLLAEITLTALRDGHDVVMSGNQSIRVAKHSTLRIRSDLVFGHFTDTTRAYRFGAPSFDAVVGQLATINGTVFATASYFPENPLVQQADLGVQIVCDWTGPTTLALKLSAARLSRLVDIEVVGARVWPNMIDIVPGHDSFVHVELLAARTAPTHGRITPLNARSPLTFSIPAQLP